MPCRVLYPLGPSSDKVTSQAWNDIYKTVKDEQVADEFYRKLHSEHFRDTFGDWVSARNLVREGYMPSLEEAARATDVSIPLNQVGEPVINKKISTYLGLTDLDSQTNLPEISVRPLSNQPSAHQNQGIDRVTLSEMRQVHANEAVIKILDGLANRTGIEYNIVSPDQARELTKNAKTPWAGEKAFFYNGKVYLLQDGISLENAIHEFAHPLVRALFKSNPIAFSSLFSTLAAASDGQRLIDEVAKLYPELTYDNDQFQEEVLVRAITERSLQFSEAPEQRSFFQRLWFHVRQMLRRAFGKAIRVDKLDENTTLGQLAEMLMHGNLNLESQLVTQQHLIAFKRDVSDLIQELQDVKEDVIVKQIDNFYDIIQNHINRIYKNGNYEDLRKLAVNEAGRSQFTTMKDLLEYGRKVKESNAKARNLAHTMVQIEALTDKIYDHIQELNKLPETQDVLKTLTYYSYILNDWSQFISNVSKELRKEGVSVRSETVAALSKIETNIKDALQLMTDNHEKVLVDILKDMLSNVKEAVDNKMKAELRRLEGEVLAGNKSAKRLLFQAKDRYKKFDLSEENLLAYLKGDNGDTNFFSGFLEAYISSPDPVVGGFAKFLKLHVQQIESTAQRFDNEMRRELDQAYRDAKIDRNKPAELGKKITCVDRILTINPETGEATEREVISLLSQFNGYRFSIAQKRDEIKKLREKGDDEQAAKLQQALNRHMVDFFHNEYVDEYYERGEIWTTPIGRVAYEKRTAIFQQIADIENQMESELPDDVRDEMLTQVELAWKEYKMLGSMRKLDGSLKTGEDLEVAKTIKTYNENNRKFHEWVEKKGLFETRLNQYKLKLIQEDHLTVGTKEYDEKLQNWIEQNTRTVLKQSFYDKRAQILERINKISKQFPDATEKSKELKVVWDEILDLVTGFRDENGQPMGTELSDERVAQVRKLQEQANEISDSFRNMSGLNKADQETLSYLFDLKKNGVRLTDGQRDVFEELLAQRQADKVSPLLRAQLIKAIDELKALQSKQASDYYIEIVNAYLAKNNLPLWDPNPSDSESNDGLLSSLRNLDPSFRTWFYKNHIEVERWDAQSQQMNKYHERLYVWNRIQPNSPADYETYTLSDGSVIQGLPSFEYYRRKVKDEYRTGYNPATKKVELQIGVHIDNTGNFLPKLNPKGQQTDLYINADYERLKQENPPVFRILEIITRYHLKAQEGLPYHNRLYMDIPRFRRHRQEYLRSGKLADDATSSLVQKLKGARALFRKENDDYEEGAGNYQAAQRMVSADLFDNEISSIPIKGTAHLDLDQVSLDVPGSIARYFLSAEENRVKNEINPIFRALNQTLEVNGVRDLTKINKSNMLNRGIKTFLKKDRYNRQEILNNLYEREFQGIEHKMELGEGMNKVANSTMRFAAFSTLAIDLPGALKNVFAARIQNFFESMGGRHVNYREYMKGSADFNTVFMPAMIKDYGRLGTKSLQSQLVDLFDPVQGRFREHFGKQYTRTPFNDFVEGKWMYSPREWGELNAQVSLMLGMMTRQKVDQVINGVTTQLMYKDAWTLDATGQLALKEGIDPIWSQNGRKFQDFKLLLHEINQKLQGNYADIDQPEVQRYTLGRMAGFMRRYATPAFTNRFSKQRLQVGIGDTREGFYMTFFRIAANTVRTGKRNWHLYSEEEKKAFWRTLMEMGSSFAFTAIMMMLGYHENDKDRFKQLEQNGWFLNHAILQLMQVKSETEQMTPLSGLDEALRFINNPSIAIGQLNKYYTVFKDLSMWAEYCAGLIDHDKLIYQNKQGVWDKGDAKLFAHVLKIAGFTGKTLSPETAIRNFDLMQDRVR